MCGLINVFATQPVSQCLIAAIFFIIVCKELKIAQKKLTSSITL